MFLKCNRVKTIKRAEGELKNIMFVILCIMFKIFYDITAWNKGSFHHQHPFSVFAIKATRLHVILIRHDSDDKNFIILVLL